MCESETVSQQQPANDPPGQDPYLQQPGYSQPGYPGYSYPGPGYPAQPPKKPLDLAKIVTIGAWVVLALHGLRYFYVLTQDEGALGVPEFTDRLFGGMDGLAVGIFYTGVLLAVGRWLEKQQQGI